MLRAHDPRLLLQCVFSCAALPAAQGAFQDALHVVALAPLAPDERTALCRAFFARFGKENVADEQARPAAAASPPRVESVRKAPLRWMDVLSSMRDSTALGKTALPLLSCVDARAAGGAGAGGARQGGRGAAALPPPLLL